jgi:hypothetical protein
VGTGFGDTERHCTSEEISGEREKKGKTNDKVDKKFGSIRLRFSLYY